jgi:hypothetical protein
MVESLLMLSLVNAFDLGSNQSIEIQSNVTKGTLYWWIVSKRLDVSLLQEERA